MTTPYPVKLSVVLKPIWHDDPPQISIGVDGETNTFLLEQSQQFDFEFDSAQVEHNLVIEFLNKTNQDTIVESGLDKAVNIEKISFFGISDPKFIWSGVYVPIYPEPWASEQAKNGVVLKQHLTDQTYLAWNGKWTLTFNVPVFTWIHNIQNLGWIYG